MASEDRVVIIMGWEGGGLMGFGVSVGELIRDKLGALW